MGDTSSNQHKTNKARHESDVKLGEAYEKLKELNVVLEDKAREMEGKDDIIEELQDTQKRLDKEIEDL